VAVTDFYFPETGPPSPSIADADHRDLDNMPNTAPGAKATHTVSLGPPPQNLSSRPETPQDLRMSPPFPPIQ